MAMITLLSDFGLRDPYVGVMKARILERAPHLILIDLTHEIEPFAIDAAGYWLYCVQGQFPPGTVHLAVVDPGVGGERALLLLQAAGQSFIAPDNGLLGLVAQADPQARAYRLEVPRLVARLGLAPCSATFHGRDLLAPVAAALASGALAPEAVGPAHTIPTGTLRPARQDADGTVRGAIAVIDRYGNLLTTVPGGLLSQMQPPEVRLAGRNFRWVRTYAEAQPQQALALINSSGMLELAVREGSAARQVNARVGQGVEVTVASTAS